MINAHKKMAQVSTHTIANRHLIPCLLGTDIKHVCIPLMSDFESCLQQDRTSHPTGVSLTITDL